jgi:hypothetical protein
MGKRRTVFVLSGLLFQSLTGVLAQSADSLITDLRFIDETIRKQSCLNPKIISNRAMNLALSDRIGYSLTDYKSLSFYKNYITFNARDGVFSLNHNLFHAAGLDEPVRTFYVVGVRANVTNALSTAFTDKTGTKQIGATLKKTWIAKPKTRLTDCVEKTIMDAKRASDLALLIEEIKRKEANFLQSLTALRQENLTDSAFAQVKEKISQDFYTNLTDEFSRRFAADQYQELVATRRYKTITTHWTNLSVYLPIILQRFTVSSSLSIPTETKKAYPFEVTLGHTRFWESRRLGRFFLSLEATAFLNNSVQSFLLTDMSYNDYKSAGGIDTLLLSSRKINSLYLGSYQSFLTPMARLNGVYYPPESHIGISATIEQNVGTYKALNCVVGIPIVLINKQGAPSANFEFQVRYFDCTHVLFPNRTLSDNLSVSLAVGIPFSKIIY